MHSVQFSDLYATALFRDVMEDILREGHSEYWLKGGRGSTKSSFISLMIVVGILADTDANAIVYRRVGNTLKDSVYSQLIWAIDKLEASAWFRFRRSPLEIEYVKTGQRILFRGADDPLKSKSIKLPRGYFKYLWFEELSEFRGMEDIRSIKQSVFRGVEHGMTFYSYNPPRSAQNWVNAEGRKEIPNRLVNHSTYLGVPEDWLKGAFLDDAETLKAVNERAYRNEYLGEVTGTGGTVFDNVETRTITDAEIDTMDKFYNGLDFGYAVDPDAFVRWGYDRKRHRMYAIDEFYGSHNTTDALAEEVKRRADRELVTCDSADSRMINELKLRGINAIGVKKGAGSVEHGLRWLQDLGAIVIDPKRTPNIAREFCEYEYVRDRRTDQFLAAYPDANNHTIDASRYAMEREISRRVATTRSDIY